MDALPVLWVSEIEQVAEQEAERHGQYDVLAVEDNAPSSSTLSYRD
jgi:hypothetical protein